jgi:hypothetical protein
MPPSLNEVRAQRVANWLVEHPGESLSVEGIVARFGYGRGQAARARRQAAELLWSEQHAVTPPFGPSGYASSCDDEHPRRRVLSTLSDLRYTISRSRNSVARIQGAALSDVASGHDLVLAAATTFLLRTMDGLEEVLDTVEEQLNGA